jgi:hypothetical protein
MVKCAMATRKLIQVQNPVTQTTEAIKSLLAYVGSASNPLPQDVSLENGRMVLVLSNKGDAYYTVTEKKCSCPAVSYHHGPCKHQRKYFAEVKAATKSKASEQLIKRGGFKPFDKLPRERATKASSFSAMSFIVAMPLFRMPSPKFAAKLSFIPQFVSVIKSLLKIAPPAAGYPSSPRARLPVMALEMQLSKCGIWAWCIL